MTLYLIYLHCPVSYSKKSSDLTGLGSLGFTGTEPSWNLHGSELGPLCICYDFVDCCSCRSLIGEM